MMGRSRSFSGMIKMHHVVATLHFNCIVEKPFISCPCCRFDGVDAMAEQEEFLPHKPGVKKEIRFTDVSASRQTEKKRQETSVLSTGSAS